MPGTLRNDVSFIDVTIANATSLSPAVDLGDLRLCGIITPSSWTTAAITFQSSADDSAYNNVYKADGAELSLTSVAASRYTLVDLADFAAIQFLKVRSGTSGTPANQTGGDTLTLVARRL